MGFLQDNLIPFFKKRVIVFKEIRRESEDVVSFLFDKPEGLAWKAGQYGLFTITHKKIKDATKPFSVSSAPAENEIRITTILRENPGEFKRALMELTPGMTVTMRGPVGPFYVKGNGPLLLIAGGIGITPFRSILKQIEAEGSKDRHTIQLLIADRDKRNIFRDELESLAEQLSISIKYVDSRDQLKQEIGKVIETCRTDGKVMIAGPQSMVKQLTAEIKETGVPKQNIIKDEFFGY